MNRPLAGRQNRFESLGTNESRPKVLRINQGKLGRQPDVPLKDSKADPAKLVPFRNVGAYNASFFGAHGLNLQVKEKKDHTPVSFFASKAVKQDQKSENDEKATKKFNLSQVWENKLSSVTKKGHSEEKPVKAHSARGSLIEHEFEVITSELERMKMFRLKPIPKQNKQVFSIGSHGILKVSQSFRLRPETIFQSLFLFHYACSELPEKKLVHYIIPCLNIAAKTEEYYPPSIDELIKKAALLSNISTLPDFHRVSKRSVIEFEAELLYRRDMIMKTPPIMDLANVLLNSLGKYQASRRTALAPYIYKLLQMEDVFTESLITIAVASVRLQENFEVDAENMCFGAKKQAAATAIELSERLLVGEFGYTLNSMAAADLVAKTASLDTVKMASFFGDASKEAKTTSFFMNR